MYHFVRPTAQRPVAGNITVNSSNAHYVAASLVHLTRALAHPIWNRVPELLSRLFALGVAVKYEGARKNFRSTGRFAAGANAPYPDDAVFVIAVVRENGSDFLRTPHHSGRPKIARTSFLIVRLRNLLAPRKA